MNQKPKTLSDFSKVPMKEKIAYFIGECGSCGMFYYLTITLSTYFYTDVMHISAITLGTIIIFSRMFDGVSDLIVGTLVDHTHTKWGKARPWVFISTFPYALSMILLYCIPASWTSAHQVAYVIITYNFAITICYTVENIPWGSLPALMTRDKVQRSQLHSVRMLASPLGSAIGVSTALPLINALGGKQSDWILVMSILAIVGICCNVLAVVLIKERVVMIDPKEKKSNKGDVLSAIHNPYWWVSILITLVWNTFIVATSILTPYYSKYFLNDSLITTAINNAQTISLAICAFSCYWLTKRWEKSTILKFSMLITILGQILLITNPLSLTTIIVGTIIRCVGFGCMGALMFAMATDAIEYGHWYTGHRAESTTYSAVGIGNKMGVLMGSGLLTILLGMAGYDGSMQVQGDMAMNMIKMLYLWSPIALAVITVIIMMFYKLDEKYDAVLKDLNANKFSPNVQLQYRENARSY